MDISKDTIDATITVIIAGSFIVTGVVTALKRFGLLHFGKKTVKVIEDRRLIQPCELHNEVHRLLTEINATQIRNVEKHKQHEHDLEIGEKKFESLRIDIGDLKEGVAVLMDRSGGIPQKFKNKKWG